MPAYEAIKAEDARRKAAARAVGDAVAAPLAAPTVPSFLPFTRWAATSPAIQSTLVVEEDVKVRPKARLSWYHPDDTMVPRDWWRGGLLADLDYYRPFRTPAVAAAA